MQKEIRIELGRVWMAADQVVRLDVGSQIVLESPAGEAVAISADGRRVARGAPAAMDGRFCVRVLEVDRREVHLNKSVSSEPVGGPP